MQEISPSPLPRKQAPKRLLDRLLNLLSFALPVLSINSTQSHDDPLPRGLKKRGVIFTWAPKPHCEVPTSHVSLSYVAVEIRNANGGRGAVPCKVRASTEPKATRETKVPAGRETAAPAADAPHVP